MGHVNAGVEPDSLADFTTSLFLNFKNYIQ